MSVINNTYEKIDKETTAFFELKREKLKKEEENLKEQLKTEVTKIIYNQFNCFIFSFN